MYPDYWDQDKDDKEATRTVECEADFGTAKNAYQVNVANNKKVQVILVKNFTKNRSLKRKEHLKKRREHRRPREVRRSKTSEGIEEPAVPVQEAPRSSSLERAEPDTYPMVKLESFEGQVNDILSD